MAPSIFQAIYITLNGVTLESVITIREIRINSGNYFLFIKELEEIKIRADEWE